MDRHDKVYLWMVVITFLALAAGMGFAIAMTNEYRESTGITAQFTTAN